MNKVVYVQVAAVLAMTMALGPFAIDTYLPAFPSMASALGVSVHEVALSISVYIFVLALGQLVAGPISDRFGRALSMYVGLSVFAAASVVLSRVASLEHLLLLRGVQAFGAGWIAVCVPAIVRDRMHGNEAARFFSLIGLIMIVAPAIAPALGSALLNLFGWQSIFLFLGGYALFLLLRIRLVIFNRHYVAPTQHPSVAVWQRYKAVLSSRRALRFLFIQSFAFTVMLIFLTHASFIYQAHYAATATQFSLLFAANIIAMIGVNLTNRKLLNRYPAARILKWALVLQAVGIVLLILVSSFAAYLWLFLPAMMITVGAMGAIVPNTQACFMDYFPEHGGTAAATLGAIQFILSGSISALTTLMPESLLSIVVAQALCSLCCLLFLFFGKGVIAKAHDEVA